MQGHLYVLSNKIFSEKIYKIGMTTRTPQERADELSRSTSIPSPFEVVYSKFSEDVGRLEGYVHQKLHDHRYNHNREFFSAELESIIKIVETFNPEAPIQQKAKALIGSFLSESLKTGLIRTWEDRYPSCQGLGYMTKFHLEFCEAIANKLLGLSQEIIVRFNDRSFSFDDGIQLFFDVKPQKNKVELAPLRLTPDEVQSIGCQFRDITGKKYRMGGLVRVDLFDHSAESLALAEELARLSLESKNQLKFWGLLNKAR
jgi:hypothetical protein